MVIASIRSSRRSPCCGGSWSAARSASVLIRRPRPALWSACGTIGSRTAMNEEKRNSEESEIVAQLDASGLFCPEPVMMLHNRIRDIEKGEVLEMLATDPSTTRDVPKFCLFLGHE